MIIATAITAFGVLLATANIIITIAVARSESYDSTQKRFQYFLIWCVPVIGTAFLWYVLREESSSGTKHGDSGNEYIADNYPDEHEGQ